VLHNLEAAFIITFDPFELLEKLKWWRSSNGFFLQFEVFSLQQGAYHGKLPGVTNTVGFADGNNSQVHEA
jgi:hypothetical protein